MTQSQLQEFLSNQSITDLNKIHHYMLKRYKVRCCSMKDLNQAIIDYIPEGYILDQLLDIIA